MGVNTEEAIRFGFLIHDVSRLRRVVVDRVLKPLGVTRSQWWVLAFLSRRDGMTQTALANDLDLTKVAMGGLLERMEAAGLVRRNVDKADARVRRVFLTRAGTRLVGEIRRCVEDAERDMLGTSSEEDVRTTIFTLLRMKEALLKKVDTFDAG